MKRIGLFLVFFALCTFVFAEQRSGLQQPTSSPISSGVFKFMAISEVYEIIGHIKGTEIIMYVDHFETNLPQQGASVEADIDGTSIPMESRKEGGYSGKLSQALAAGDHTVTVAVITAYDNDLLTSSFSDASDPVVQPALAENVPFLTVVVSVAIAGGLIVLGLWIFRFVRRKKRGIA